MARASVPRNGLLPSICLNRASQNPKCCDCDVETPPAASTARTNAPGACPQFCTRGLRPEGNEYVSYLRLTGATGHALLAKGDGTGASLAEAIAGALGQVEKELLKQAWRCRVTDTAGGKLIIPYGRFDGLRKGQMFLGYAMTAEAQKEETPVDELLLLKHGSRAGSYRVVEVGEEFTSLEPIENSATLKKGDVLEVPAADLQESHRSRSSVIWDKIYEKKR